MGDAIKMTFTLDRETADRIDKTARRLGLPKSGVVREAVAEYAARAGRLGEAERLRMLRVLDGVIRRPATRPQADVEREITEVRTARRTGGRRSRDE